MKNLLIILCLFSAAFAKAQDNKLHLQAINQDIWLPFKEAYGTLNVEKYKNLHLKDFIRASAQEKRLPNFEDYFKTSGDWFSDLKKKNQRLEIDFRFIERFANEKTASERGIYALKCFDSEGKMLWTGYGKFHVFLRKDQDIWKIVVDYDSDEQKTINESVFNNAFDMNDFEKY